MSEKMRFEVKGIIERYYLKDYEVESSRNLGMCRVAKTPIFVLESKEEKLGGYKYLLELKERGWVSEDLERLEETKIGYAKLRRVREVEETELNYKAREELELKLEVISIGEGGELLDEGVYIRSDIEENYVRFNIKRGYSLNLCDYFDIVKEIKYNEEEVSKRYKVLPSEEELEGLFKSYEEEEKSLRKGSESMRSKYNIEGLRVHNYMEKESGELKKKEVIIVECKGNYYELERGEEKEWKLKLLGESKIYTHKLKKNIRIGLELELKGFKEIVYRGHIRESYVTVEIIEGLELLEGGVLESLCEKSVRYKESKVPVWVFKGRSALGKSYLANKIVDGDMTVFETDMYKELPSKINANIIVLGVKYPYSIEDIVKRLPEEVELIEVEFKGRG